MDTETIDEPRRPAGLLSTGASRALLVMAVLAVTFASAGTAYAMKGVAANQAATQLAAAQPAGAAPEGCVAPDRQLQLYAVELPRDPVTNQIRLGYGLTPETASYPGPTMEMIEGECLAITLHNQVTAETLAQLRTNPAHPLGVSLHVHGVKYTQDSDGTVHSGSYVAPGESRTYTWYAKPRSSRTGSPGTAGYWWYHDHVVGGPHGTQGLNSGLFGGLVVRRQGDPQPDRTYVTAFGDRQSINLRRGAAADDCDLDNPVPGPACFVAKVGERVEFIVIGLGDDMHTWHVHGHAWADTRTGVVAGDNKAIVDSIPVIDNKTLGPGDSFGVTIVAGDSVGPGHWMLHCHMQFHSDLGMATTLHVLDANGQMPPGGHHHRDVANQLPLDVDANAGSDDAPDTGDVLAGEHHAGTHS
ncbi:multicopper oxidase domain-containing protein [Micromonospora sp. NBC_01813]|uniref:multicopper oxidase domain-containing protein n=1 Tax=Micromonospora sp. NBC_01813 TaxID=2975988 RepID=UPI002DD965CB|nr:multicopper oxidase domain-containing protein [Micromonospora sp. NBC_01813]WSA10139.1 multicopper oxidase domain-containing protein [Micromonospora sp. NBC_01813]